MVQDLRLGISTLSDVSENFRPHSLSQAGSMFRMAFRMSLWGFPCKVRDNLMVRKRHETVVFSKKCLQNFVRGFQNFVRSLFFSLRSLFFFAKEPPVNPCCKTRCSIPPLGEAGGGHHPDHHQLQGLRPHLKDENLQKSDKK